MPISDNEDLLNSARLPLNRLNNKQLRTNSQNLLPRKNCNLLFRNAKLGFLSGTIYNSLSGIKQQLDCSIDQIMDVIEEHINHFFVQALQLDHFTLRQEAMDNEVYLNSEFRT